MPFLTTITLSFEFYAHDTTATTSNTSIEAEDLMLSKYSRVVGERCYHNLNCVVALLQVHVCTYVLIVSAKLMENHSFWHVHSRSSSSR